jgi:twitching motility two-component system response regulator PilH
MIPKSTIHNERKSLQARDREVAMAKILVVDDSPTQLKNLAKLVEGQGHEAITAEDGMAGVNAAQEHQPDLILMDVVMPELNGFQATRKITQEEDTSHIPVIIVTTKDQQTDQVWGKRQGASDYMIKPPDEKDLIAKINAYVS